MSDPLPSVAPLARARRFLAKPQLRAAPVRFVARRAAFEASRRRGRPGGVRLARLWPTDVEAFVPVDDLIGRALYLNGVYEPLASAVFRDAADVGTVAVDVGAQYGDFALVAAASAANVLAFEPEPHARVLLERSVVHNGLRNVTVHSCALGAETGTATLFRSSDPRNTGAASLLSDMAGQQGDAVETEVRRLDDVVGDTGPVRVVKVDVEGAEVAVLRGALGVLGRDAPAVVTEVNDLSAEGRSETLDLLRDAGYTVCGLGGTPERVVLTPVAPGETAPGEPWLALNVVALKPGSPAAETLRRNGHVVA